jgi:hypothetical protein
MGRGTQGKREAIQNEYFADEKQNFISITKRFIKNITGKDEV